MMPFDNIYALLMHIHLQPLIDDNHVITIPQEEYEETALSRTTVVSSFLTSDVFQEITPEGLTIPAPAPYNRGSDPTVVTGGSIPMVVSMVTVLGVALFSLYI